MPIILRFFDLSPPPPHTHTHPSKLVSVPLFVLPSQSTLTTYNPKHAPDTPTPPSSPPPSLPPSPFAGSGRGEERGREEISKVFRKWWCCLRCVACAAPGFVSRYMSSKLSLVAPTPPSPTPPLPGGTALRAPLPPPKKKYTVFFGCFLFSLSLCLFPPPPR